MELLQGQDLRSLMEHHALTLKQKRDLILQALEGLGYAHAQQVVHRDVKPENLFVTVQGVLKVADFGFAKQFGVNSITMTGSMGGTPYYMSPEQITDLRNADHRSDLYAIGAVAYELFAGQVPFETEGLTQLLLMHLEKIPPSMRSLRPELPPQLDTIVLRLLSKQREQRFQTCAEVAHALKGVAL
jgi:serine/threonine-protein kinase